MSLKANRLVLKNNLEIFRMKKSVQISILFLFAALLVPAAFAGNSPDNLWQEVSDFYLRTNGAQRTVVPEYYRTFRLNKNELASVLKNAPMEFTDSAVSNPMILTLPMPDGTFARFSIVRSPVIEPGLAVKYPELNETFRGQGIDDPTASVRFDFLPSGFHSMILSPNGTVLVDPYAKGDTDNYISYFKKAAPKTDNFVCLFENADAFDEISRTKNFDPNNFIPDSSPESVVSGSQLRTYRLALAATGEYTAAVGGGTVAGALAARAAEEATAQFDPPVRLKAGGEFIDTAEHVG